MEKQRKVHQLNETKSYCAMRRNKPEISTSSMADIAFLLLVFFLVATTIDIDSGLFRKLPPYEPDPDPPKFIPRNVLNVLVNSKDELMINNRLYKLEDVREIAYEFLLNPNNDSDKPTKKTKRITHLGEIEVPQGIISLQNHRGTSYNMYIQVLNELTASSIKVKNELSLEKFGKKFNDLSVKLQKAVNQARPCIISEAEPAQIR